MLDPDAVEAARYSRDTAAHGDGTAEWAPVPVPPSSPLKPALSASGRLPARSTSLRRFIRARPRTIDEVEAGRCTKWTAMLADWPRWGGAGAGRARSTVVKSRCRKGVPDALRRLVWPVLLGVEEARAADPTLYADLLSLPIFLPGCAPPLPPGAGEARPPPLVRGGVTTELIDTIERDINRTLPSHALFAEVGGAGQSSLFRVLVAYAQADTVVGYCQGMGFVVALLLTHLPEEDAFWTFHCLMTRPPHNLRVLYGPGLPRVAEIEGVLTRLSTSQLPKLSAHLNSLGLRPSMYAAQWILTLFTYSMPLPVVARVWDAFLREGWKVFYRVCLGLLKLGEPALLDCTSFEDALFTIKAAQHTIKGDELMDAAFSMRFHRADLGPAEVEAQRMGKGEKTA